MDKVILGTLYPKGEVIVRQGEAGAFMYVIQTGQVEVVHTTPEGGSEVRLAVLDTGDVFGEMALFEREVRSATVRALTDARVLTVDKRLFLRRIHEDPSLAFQILEKMSRRIRQLNAALTKMKADAGPPKPSC